MVLSGTQMLDTLTRNKLRQDLCNPSLKPSTGNKVNLHGNGVSSLLASSQVEFSRQTLHGCSNRAEDKKLKNNLLLSSPGKGSLKGETDRLSSDYKTKLTTSDNIRNSRSLHNAAISNSTVLTRSTLVTNLQSNLTVTSCHLYTRPSCSTNLSLSSSLALGGKTGPTRSSFSPKELKPRVLASNVLIGDKPLTRDDLAVEKKMRKKRHYEDADTTEEMEMKKPRYNIDWSVTDVESDVQEVTMDGIVPEEPKVSKPGDKPDEGYDTKRRFINAISASLLRAPNFKAIDDSTRKAFVEMCDQVAKLDPEFILKVAIYNRRDLNIRGASSFLLAYAAHNPSCRPFLKKYFKQTVILPSDWIEIAEIYQTFQDATLSFGSLPTALRRVMIEKFPDFDTYQLGKYNKDKKAKPKPNKTLNRREQKRHDRHHQFGLTSSEPVPDEDSDEEKEVELKTFTLKQLIRQLHISKPVHHVMALVGKKYPTTREEFYKCNLPGEFDESLAGKRMKLPTPETWETQVSLRGNKAEVWQSLIDHKKLPFMAMLRNIRNMLKAGISEKHHQWVISKLTDEGSIANSKQFPFRFFSAYTVLNELEKDYTKHQEKLVELAEKLELAEAREVSRFVMNESARKKKKKKEERRADQKKNEMRKRLKQDLRYDIQLVDRYRKALDTSVELATNYNVPPIPGVTIILCNVGSSMFRPCTTYKGMGQPRQVVEVGILLGLMCKHSCESSQLLLYANGSQSKVVELDKAGILTNTTTLMSYANLCNESTQEPEIPKHLLREILLDRKHVDNIIVLSDGLRYDEPDGVKMEEFLKVYRHHVNSRVLFVSIDLSSGKTGVDAGLVSRHPNDVFLAGFSDQLLRFVAERGDSGQMTYIENIDAKYNLIALPSAANSGENNSAKQRKSVSSSDLQIIPTKTLTWRVARVFISSTFLDMHGERDMLTRFVFPEIRQWAAKRLVNVLDVDLRWGVSQHATRESGSLAMCLSEVMNCDLFIGILGDRSGWKPEMEEIPRDSDYDWMRKLPQPQSATALEIQLALRIKSVTECFFFIRDSEFIRDGSMPAEYLKTFVDKNQNLEALKELICQSGAEVYQNYPAKWAGVVDGKPMTGGLEMFAIRAMEMLKTAIAELYPLEEVYKDELEEIRSWQDSLIITGCDRFTARSGTLKEFHRTYNAFTSGICVIHGEVGVGKTTFMCRIAHEAEQCEEPTFHHIVCTGYSDMTTILRRLCHEISGEFSLEYEPVYDYYDLVEALAELLEKVGKVADSPYVILIDGLDHLDSDNSAQSCNWLPDAIPQNIVVLLSCTTGSDSHRALGRRRDISQLELRSLEVLDKSVLIRETLAAHGKTLDESAFNNQMKLLTGKRGASNPLYLMLACEQIRYHGVFDTVTDKLKQMPQTLPKLLEFIFSSLEIDFGAPLISKLMKLFYCLPSGVNITDMKHMLSAYGNAVSNLDLGHAQALFSELSADDVIPALTFTQILHRLGILLDDYSSNGVLRLSYGSVKEVIKRKYLKSSDSELQTHILISGYYLSLIQGFRPEARYIRYYTDVIYHMKCGGQFAALKNMLTDLSFLHSKCSLGLATSLNNDFSTELPAKLGYTAEKKWTETVKAVQEFAQFIYKSTHLLLRSPSQLIQLALNEPDSSIISSAARGVVNMAGINYVDWLTKPQQTNQCLATIQTTTVVHSTAISPNGQLLAVGSEDCRVHMYSLSTSEEVMTLVGHAHLISDLCFVSGNRLMSASHDQTVCLWDLDIGHRLAVMNKHQRRVSSCVSTKLSLLTASWDGLVKMWTRDGKLKNDVCRVPSPINDMSIHKDEVYAAIACWDSTIKIYNILTNKRLAVLHGHQSSVRSVSYSNTGKYISSVALDGEVKLWSAVNGSQMGSFEGHSLPVRDLCFSFDGDRLITAAEDGRVKVWSGQLGLCMDTWKAEREDKAVDAISCVAIDGQCARIAVGTNLGILMCFEKDDISAPSYRVCPEDNVSITALCWAADNLSIFCATSTGSLYLWSITGGAEAIETGNGVCSIMSIASSVTWVLAFTSDRGCVTVRNYSGDERREDVTRHAGAVLSSSFSFTGNLLATGGADCKIVVWKVENSNDLELTYLTTINQAHLDWVNALSWSDAVNMLASGSSDCLVNLWDFTKSSLPTTPKYQLEGHEGAVTSISYRAGCIVSTSMDGTTKVWSQKGTQVTSIKCRAGTVNTCSLGICLSSSNVEDEFEDATWADQMDYEDASPTQSKATKAKLRADMAKNVLVAIGTSNGSVQLWNPLQANEADQYTTTSAVMSVCTHAGKVVSSHLDNTIRIWNLASAAVQSNTEHIVGQRSDYHQVTAFAMADHYLISGSLDGHVSLWDTGVPVPTLLHKLKVSDRAISTISECLSKSLIAGDENGIIFYLDIVSRRNSSKPNLRVRNMLNSADTLKLKESTVELKPVIQTIYNKGEVMLVYGDHSGFSIVKGNSMSNSDGYKLKHLQTGFNIRVSLYNDLRGFMELLVHQEIFGQMLRYPKDIITSILCFRGNYWIGTDKGLIHSFGGEVSGKHEGRVTCLSYCSGYLVSCSEDCSIKMWDTDSMELIGQFTCPAPITSVLACNMDLPIAAKAKCDAKAMTVYVGDKLGEVHRLQFFLMK